MPDLLSLLSTGESQVLEFKASFDKAAFEFDGSVQRKERFAYPLPAIREALINAVVQAQFSG
jgi:ATP-dependent DNA helicase RecG